MPCTFADLVHLTAYNHGCVRKEWTWCDSKTIFEISKCVCALPVCYYYPAGAPSKTKIIFFLFATTDD